LSQPARPPSLFLDDREPVSFDQARVAVLPVPYEATVSYGGGTSRGPAAILEASRQIESFHPLLGFEPGACGIWTEPALTWPADASPEQVVARIDRRCGELMDAGKWVVMLGGEHSITPGGVRAAAARHPGLHVVQLDAHADLRESYQGQRFSHACAMARCLEHAPVRAIGIRSYSPEEARRMPGIAGYRLVPGHELGRAGWIERALEGLDGRPVYLTVDVDYFDPAVMPATGTPEPGGGAWWPALDLLAELFGRTRVVAADVVELAPVPGLHHADFTAASLVFWLIGLAVRP